LRRIVDISRLPSRLISTAVRQQLKDLVKNSCTFVNNWDDPLVQRDALRMFATQRARRDAEKRMLAKVKQQHRNNMLCAHAQDFESSTEGNWVKATKATSRLLVQVGKVKEPKELYFYPRAIYEITFNREGRFSQSQLSVLAEMPSFADVRNFEPVTLYVAPEGMKAIPSKLTTEQDFLRESFTRQLIGTAPERPKDLGSGILGKRRQYGLHHRFAATIHAAMGQDLPNVVTKIIGDKMYHLFMREQVVVLLSRTHYAKDIIFVGDAEETAEALAVMLDSDGPYSEYMEYLVEKLLEHSSTNSPCVDLTSQDLFHPIDIRMPKSTSGYVYLLASMAPGIKNRVTYIGQTFNLVARFEKHQLGAGPSSTADPGLKPWVLLAYVSGFEINDRRPLLTLEDLWKVVRDRENRQHRQQHLPLLRADDIASLGEKIITERTYQQCPALADQNLIFVRCGRFSSHFLSS
jgi:predicted GIY-YIG superfamily endonuclease